MNSVEDESKLIVEACQGSMPAFEALVITYEPRIRRMIYSMTHDVQLTQDLCQETFLAAYRAMPRMKSDELRFAPWLYRIALNQVRSEWRRRKHMTWVSFMAPQSGGEEAFDEPGEEFLVSDEHFEDQVMQRDLVEQALKLLPPTSVMCLLLDAEGFSYSEIAETMHESLSAVRSRLFRARQSFQRIYARLGQEGEA